MTTSHEPQSVLLLDHDLMITDGLTALPGRSLLRFEHRGSRQEGQRASEALCESEERFRALIENSSDGIALVAADGTIEYSSTNRVLGYAPSELAGRNAFDLVHLDDRPQVMKLLRGFSEEPGAKLTYVARTLHADGSWRWL
ncbi:MAG: PAS domain-containing protein, partial [Thermoanaerobaculia bacterium]